MPHMTSGTRFGGNKARPQNHSSLAFPTINPAALVFWSPNCPNWVEVQINHETQIDRFQHDSLGVGVSSSFSHPSHRAASDRARHEDSRPARKQRRNQGILPMALFWQRAHGFRNADAGLGYV